MPCSQVCANYHQPRTSVHGDSQESHTLVHGDSQEPRTLVHGDSQEPRTLVRGDYFQLFRPAFCRPHHKWVVLVLHVMDSSYHCPPIRQEAARAAASPPTSGISLAVSTIQCARCVAFKLLKNAVPRYPLTNPEHDVHVVWHYRQGHDLPSAMLCGGQQLLLDNSGMFEFKNSGRLLHLGTSCPAKPWHPAIHRRSVAVVAHARSRSGSDSRNGPS